MITLAFFRFVEITFDAMIRYWPFNIIPNYPDIYRNSRGGRLWVRLRLADAGCGLWRFIVKTWYKAATAKFEMEKRKRFFVLASRHIAQRRRGER
jgi:hypothetical protein